METSILKRSLRVALAGLLAWSACVSARADYSATVLAKNPVGYWRFDQTSQPPTPAVATNYGSAGAANGLYLNGVKQLVPDAMPATTDTAPFFDGFSQKVEVPYNAALNPPGAFTVEAWVRPMTVEGYDNKWFRAVVRNGTQQDGGGFQIQFDTGTVASPGVFKFTLWNSSSSLEVFKILAEAGNILATNNGPWFHLAGSWSSSDNIGRIYVNGVELTNRTFAYAPNTRAPLRIGGGDIGPTDVWGQSFDPGPICKVAVYGTQLTAAQIAAHYENGTNTAPATPYSTLIGGAGPAGYWPLDETNIPAYPVLTNLGTALSALDGGYGNNLTAAVAGPQPANYDGFESTNAAAFVSSAGGNAWVPPVKNAAASNLLTITAWVKRSGPQMGAATIFGRRVPGGEKSAFSFDGSGLNKLSYNWDDNASQYNFDTKLTVPDNVWTLAAVVITPSNAVVYMDYGAGLQTASNNFANTTLAGFTHEILIGPSGPYAGRRFNGTVDEIAVWTNALTYADMMDLRTAAFGNGLFLLTSPASRPSMLGGRLPFNCVAGAGTSMLPLTYQLLKNDAPAGAPSSSPTIIYSNVAAGDFTSNFKISVTTNGGSSASLTSSPASIVRWTIPGTYSGLVESMRPDGYYRLNTNASVAYEIAQSADAAFFNSATRTGGPQPTDQVGFEVGNGAYTIGKTIGYIATGTPIINTNWITVTAWVNPSAQNEVTRGIYFSRGGSGYAAFSFADGGGCQLDVTMSGNFNVGSGVFARAGVWNFVAMAVTSTNVTFYCYNATDGWQTSTKVRNFAVQNLTGSTTGIGTDPFDLANRAMDGQIDEVAVFNRTLTADEITQLANAGFNVNLSIEPTGGNTYNVGWSYGTLQSALDVTGPWSPVGGAVAPLYLDSGSSTQKFYKVSP